MNRIEIRQIESQKESEKEITGHEAEELLRKYGYDQEYSTIPNKIHKKNIDNNLTFEEMVIRQEQIKKENQLKEINKKNAPKPITFDGSNGYNTKVKYGTDDDTGFGFKIEISSDMKL